MDKFDDILALLKSQEAAGAAKASELINTIKAQDFLKKKEEEEKQSNCLALVVGIIIGIILLAGIAYALYRYFTPDYLDDFDEDLDDDFDDDFEDDFLDDEQEDPEEE